MTLTHSAHIAGLPEGEVQAIADRDRLLAELEQRYTWSSLSTADQARIAALLATINPQLLASGGLAGTADAADPRLIVGDVTWQQCYEVMADAQILFPGVAWFASQATPSLNLPSEVIHGTPQHHWLTLQGAGLNGEDIIIRVDVDGTRVVSAIAVIGQQQYPVIPLSRNERLDPSHRIGEHFPERWLSVDGEQLTGCARILIAWRKRSKISYALRFDAMLGDSAGGTYVIRLRGEDRKARSETRDPAPVVAARPSQLTDPITASWRTQFGNTGDGAGVAGSTVGAGTDARLAWVSSHTIPLTAADRIHAERITQGSWYASLWGWSSPLVDDGMVFLNYYTPLAKCMPMALGQYLTMRWRAVALT